MNRPVEPGRRHLGWDAFQVLIDAGPPAVERIAGEPQVELFTDPQGSRIGFRTPSLGVALPPSPLTEIDIETVTFSDGEPVIEVSTRNRPLYRDFYALSCAVADRLQVDHLPIDRAITDALEAWAALLEQLVVLSIEKQLGLLGELWVLERIGDATGFDRAITAWKGADAEEHDFSLAAVDLEVKTTSSERRLHMISGLSQLVPNPGRPLNLVSIQLTGAGAGEGWTLADRVEELGSRIRAYGANVEDTFRARLVQAGWQDSHAAHYRRRFALRSDPVLVPVDDACPAIVPSTLDSLGADRLSRVVHVAYRIDVTGLGFPDGSPEFLATLP